MAEETGQTSFLSESVEAATAPQGGGGQAIDNTTGTTVDGKTSPNWTVHLQKEIQGNPEFAKYPSLTDFGKAHLANVEKLQKAIVLPGEGAKPEEWAAFYEKLGRPQKEAEYELKRPENISEAVQVNDAEFRVFAHKHNLTKAQAAGAYQDYLLIRDAEQKANDKLINDWKEEISRKFKSEIWKTEEVFKQKKTASKRAMQIAIGDDKELGAQAAEYFDLSGDGMNPVLIQLFANLGEKFGDDLSIPGSTGGIGKETPRDSEGYPMLYK